MQDVETLTATVDLDEVQSYRASVASLQEQASSAARVPCIDVDFALCGGAEAFVPMQLSAEVSPRRCAPGSSARALTV
jgi:NAD+ synthase (glutamine-hydrolysing)